MLEVLYIAGMGRSGSTLLSRLLDAGDDTVALGELMRLRPATDVCSCGEDAQRCAFWGPAFSRPGARMPELGPLSQQINKKVLAPWVASGNARLRRLSGRDGHLRRYRHSLTEFLSNVESVVGNRALIDKSLSPYHLAVLAEMPDVRLRVIHLTRDPRAVAHSLNRTATETAGQNYFGAGWFWTARFYTGRHVLTEAVIRTRELMAARVKYEDLARDPISTIANLRRALELPEATEISIDDETTQLPQSHLFSANRMRFQQGPIRIRVDDAWTTGSSRAQNSAVALATAPLMVRYGYGRAG